MSTIASPLVSDVAVEQRELSSDAVPASGAPVLDPAAERRLAVLVEHLRERDERHLAEADSRRPALWLAAMTVTAAAFAHLAFLAAAPIVSL